MDLSSTGCVNEESGAGGGGDVIPPPPEYCRPVYIHLEDTLAMYGGGVTAGGAGVNAMVGEGRPRTRVGIDGEGDRDGDWGGWGRDDGDM